MSDGNLTIEIMNKMVAEHAPCGCGTAATQWFKYTGSPQDIAQPRIGEWGLWSIVTRYGREYFSGKQISSHEIWTDCGKTLRIGEEAYFARVRMIAAAA